MKDNNLEKLIDLFKPYLTPRQIYMAIIRAKISVIYEKIKLFFRLTFYG
jgi:hypothetical protein